MKCRKIQKRLSIYIDGELDKKYQEIVKEHIKKCETCQYVLNTLTRTWSLIDILPEAKSVPFFYTRLKARMNTRIKSQRIGRIERFVISISVAVAVLLGILVGSIVGRNGEFQSRKPSAKNEIVEALSLDSFDDLPGTSFGKVYFELTGQNQNLENTSQ